MWHGGCSFSHSRLYSRERAESRRGRAICSRISSRGTVRFGFLTLLATGREHRPHKRAVVETRGRGLPSLAGKFAPDLFEVRAWHVLHGVIRAPVRQCVTRE